MGYIGQIEPYDGSSDLEAYLERLEPYFVANNVGAVGSGVDESVRGRRQDGSGYTTHSGRPGNVSSS